MNRFQEETDAWVRDKKIGYFQPLEMLARLTEEVGELAREFNHRFGPKKKKPTEDTKDIEGELGDILFTLACIANALDVDLERGFETTMEKLHTRDKDRWETKGQ